MSLLDQAKEFIQQVYQNDADKLSSRIAQIQAEIKKTGTYEHTSEELEYGAKLAWKNHSQCIGKVHWRSLKVFDKRSAKTEEEIFEGCLNHLRGSRTAGGSLQPAATLFRPKQGDKEIRIWNPQLIRYAGYRNEDGSVLGDPDHVEVTEKILAMGWKKEPRTQFDILPIVIQIDGKPPKYFELPSEDAIEVPISHPKYPKIADLGLKWHGIPVIANMKFELGGIHYTAAPFSGWYVSTELVRNFTDPSRYNLSEQIAEAIDEPKDKFSLYKDRALVELNAAILYSYNQAKITVADHHASYKLFSNFVEKERKEGRDTPVKWSWIISPISGNLTPLYYKQFNAVKLQPAITYQSDVWRPDRVNVARGEADLEPNASKSNSNQRTVSTSKGNSTNERFLLLCLFILVLALIVRNFV